MEKLEWGRKLIFLMLFVFSWPKCCGVRIERKASGDVFEKGYYSLRDDRLKVDCSVGGEYGYGTGSASPVSFTNSTHCRCGSGQTFCFDDAINEPKCMVKYGQDFDDLGEINFIIESCVYLHLHRYLHLLYSAVCCDRKKLHHKLLTNFLCHYTHCCG